MGTRCREVFLSPISDVVALKLCAQQTSWIWVVSLSPARLWFRASPRRQVVAPVARPGFKVPNSAKSPNGRQEVGKLFGFGFDVRCGLGHRWVTFTLSIDVGHMMCRPKGLRNLFLT